MSTGETDDDESSLTWAMANLFVEGRKRDSGLKMARRSRKDTTSPSGCVIIKAREYLPLEKTTRKR